MEESKKKILYIITKSNWGGAQRYVYDLATHFANNFDVSVALGGTGAPNAETGILKEKLEQIGVRTILIKNFARDIFIFKEIRSLIELIKKIRSESPDIVHLNSSKAGGLGALGSRLAGAKKILYTVHGWPFNEKRFFLMKIFIWFASWFTALLSTDIIVISQNDLSQAKKMPFIGKKLYLIHNGIADARFYGRDEAREKLRDLIKPSLYNFNMFGKSKIVGTIAELTENKGLIYAIRAFDDSDIDDDTLYVIIGEGEKYWELKKEIAKLNLEDKVFLAGFIKDAGMFINAFDIFLLPSIKEGLPYTLLEAELAGVPIIATAAGGARELVEDKNAGTIVESRNPKGITVAIKDILGKERVPSQNRVQKSEDRHKNMISETERLYFS